jgi:putative endonuclease
MDRFFIYKMYSVYVLHSKTFNKIYIGYTSNLDSRLLSHNELATKGYTVKYRPWTIIHSEAFDNKLDAMKREKQLKSAKGREFIWSIVK